MVPISALSRSPAILSIEMDSSRVRASSSLRTGVLPTLTTCLGLWTDVAGLVSSVPPETIQSKHRLMAERCCLTEGRERGELLDVSRDVDGPDWTPAGGAPAARTSP